MTSEDFNADGRPDLAVTNSGSFSVSVLLDRASATARASLRRHADQDVATRPRVRAGGYQPIGHTGPVKAPPRNPSGVTKPKSCGGGQCRHRADCSDTYCPGRLSASLAGTPKARHAHH